MQVASSSRRRSVLHGCAAALFGALSLVGQGLHLVPGLGHSHGCGECLSALHGAGEHDCDHEAQSGATGWTQSDGWGHRGTCPICDFFASGKLVTTTAAAVWSTQVVSFESPSAPVPSPQRQVNRLGPRGPPRV